MQDNLRSVIINFEDVYKIEDKATKREILSLVYQNFLNLW